MAHGGEAQSGASTLMHTHGAPSQKDHGGFYPQRGQQQQEASWEGSCLSDASSYLLTQQLGVYGGLEDQVLEDGCEGRHPNASSHQH